MVHEDAAEKERSANDMIMQLDHENSMRQQ
jgi:hypothetical protein